MKRAEAKKKANNPRWNKPPKTYTRKELASSVELIRELLMEIDATILRMKERRIEELTISGGGGSEAFTRAESAIKAWGKGMREAFLEQVKNGGELNPPIGG